MATELITHCESVGPTVPDRFRSIQLHPTRRCNLACLHCYSYSAPHHRDMLDVEATKKFLAYAFEEGFNNIAISGGEPFLYSDLEELLRFAKEIGYQTTMASNGMLLKTERAKRILAFVDLIAISIDGPPPLHDHIRAQKGAFEKMMEGVKVLQQHQKPFGFIHTVTPQSWESLLWLGEFAEQNGAKLLQLHPLEMHGRASETLTSLAMDDTLAHQMYILAHYLRSKYADSMIVQIDLLHREYIRTFPQVVSAFSRQCAANNHLSDLFDTIIVDETGKITPVAYGFGDQFSIGNIHRFDYQLFERFIQEKVPSLKKVFEKTLDKIINNFETDIVNWNELIVQESIAA
ncbi:radical SAM protein [Runella limosa]|uniref:radical SAM protein n=1 Tax=Runella limosa TaxID=370978 RepID=UPI0009FCDA48|nr:radical SAM protein [Runella limosa]